MNMQSSWDSTRTGRGHAKLATPIPFTLNVIRRYNSRSSYVKFKVLPIYNSVSVSFISLKVIVIEENILNYTLGQITYYCEP